MGKGRGRGDGRGLVEGHNPFLMQVRERSLGTVGAEPRGSSQARCGLCWACRGLRALEQRSTSESLSRRTGSAIWGGLGKNRLGQKEGRRNPHRVAAVGALCLGHGWQAPGEEGREDREGAGVGAAGRSWGRTEAALSSTCWLESEARVECWGEHQDPRDPRTRQPKSSKPRVWQGPLSRLRGAAPRHVLLTRDVAGVQLHSLRGHPPGGQAPGAQGAGGRRPPAAH